MKLNLSFLAKASWLTLPLIEKPKLLAVLHFLNRFRCRPTRLIFWWRELTSRFRIKCLTAALRQRGKYGVCVVLH